MKKQAICVHGHFYQPPRENPWLEAVEFQESAYPMHDWNERISIECYLPNAAARLVDDSGRIIDIVNNYAAMSFNFGPTLLSWMKKNQPAVYRRIINSDKKSLHKYKGNGSAIAQCYNHMIMPLASDRDKKTQVIWGIEDFISHFKRPPIGMWLPETAVDTGSLEALAEEGIQFTILASHQAKRMRKIGDAAWRKMDDKFFLQDPFLCRLPSGRTIVIFFYDGNIAWKISFGELLEDGRKLGESLASDFKEGLESQIASIATDGETFGHHKKFGDMALAACFRFLQSQKKEITNFTKYLKEHPPQFEVEINENTSWSCAHGIGRWMRDCSCNLGACPGGNQAWREHLRNAMDYLRDRIDAIYEQEMEQLVEDPWMVRNKYIQVVSNRLKANVEDFLQRYAKRPKEANDKKAILRFLEMQRHCMLSYTSCGWFFDDISSIESTQILKYAKRVLQLLKLPDVEEEFKKILSHAKSNFPKYKDGRYIFEHLIRPVDLKQVAGNYAISSMFEDFGKKSAFFCFDIFKLAFEKLEVGVYKLAHGSIRIFSTITWEEESFSYLALNLHNYQIIALIFPQDDPGLMAACKKIKKAFLNSEFTRILEMLKDLEPSARLTLWDLFFDGRKKILDQLQLAAAAEIDNSLQQAIEKNFTIIRELKDHQSLSDELLERALESFFIAKISHYLKGENNTADTGKWVQKAIDWQIALDKMPLRLAAEKRLLQMMQKWKEEPYNLGQIEEICHFLDLFYVQLGIQINLWEAQNFCWYIRKEYYPDMKNLQTQDDAIAIKWLGFFNKIAEYMIMSL